MFNNTDPFTLFIIVLIIGNIVISLLNSRRKLGTRILEKSVSVPKRVEVPFPYQKPIDIDKHLMELHEHIAQYGVEGTPETIQDFLGWMYAEDYPVKFWRDKNKIYHYEEENL